MIKSRMIKRKIIALCITLGIFVPFIASNSAYAAYTPSDTVSIAKQADGTHNDTAKPFITTENGFSVADNTSTDGVVGSNDVVTYNLTLSIKAGAARDEILTLSGDTQYLDLSNIAINFGNSVTATKLSDTQYKLSIARGVAGTFTTAIIATAKDTKGTVVKDQVLQAVLTYGSGSTATQLANSYSDPVTIVSYPMADLTLDTNYTNTISFTYTQKSSGGSFNIVPRTLVPSGYTNAGLTSGGTWKTDVDVSSFPSGTTFTFNGTTVTPDSSGVIRGLSGTGTAKLSYTLPSSALPTADNPSQTYTAFLIPAEDSFSVGDVKNVTDPGSGQSATYNTSTYTINGTSMGAVAGVTYPNNNYSRNYWDYYAQPEGSAWIVSLIGPRNYSMSYYDNANIYWPSGTDAQNYASGRIRTVFADNTQLAVSSTLNLQNSSVKAITDTSKVVFEDDLNTRNSSNAVSVDYDTTKQVVLLYDYNASTPLDPSKYTVTWLVGSQWLESSTPISGATKVRVTLAKGVDISSNSTLTAYFPLQARTYDASQTGNLMQNTEYLSIDGLASTNKLTTSSVLIKPNPITVSTEITNDSTKTTNVESSKRTSWTVSSTIVSDAVQQPFDLYETFTLDKAFDPSTIQFSDSNWQVVSISGQTVTVKRTGLTLSNTDNKGRWSTTFSADFTVDTISNFNPGTDTYTASISNVAKTTWSTSASALRYGIDSQSGNTVEGYAQSATSTASIVIPIESSVYSELKAVNKTAEIGDTLQWDATVNTPYATNSWDSVLYMPANGDVSNMNTVNTANNTNIDIDSTTGKDKNGIYDGIGRSKYTGSVKLTGLQITAVTTKVQLKFLDSSGKTLGTRTVSSTGNVDLTGIDTSKLASIAFDGVASTMSMQSSGVSMRLTMTPTSNTAGDAYVMWFGKTESGTASVVSWPDDISVVSSSISGNIFQDSNHNYAYDSSETGYSGVHVNLVQNGTVVASTTTDDDGSYSFTNLHSGNYQVVLPKITRKANSNVVSQINGSTGVN
ncbi:MAG: SdrD B-like domain-containing protein, partial [Bifidobacteriaceae bacterium]|nr:SdrD B-like domain-containing protein [Bifidobacteriaceae bacterium]